MKPLNNIYCRVILICICIPFFAQAQQHAYVDRVIIDEMNLQQIPGVVVAVVNNGTIVHQKAYGYSDANRSQALGINDFFRLASVSKLYTAIAVHRLVKDRKIGSLDDKVTKYVSYWPGSGTVADADAKKEITIRQLLSHRSGIAHTSSSIKPTAYNVVDGSYDAKKGLDVFREGALLFNPGDSFHYSTFGYGLLAAVIEEASGTSYQSYMQSMANAFRLGTVRPSTTTFTGFRKDCDGKLITKTLNQTEWKMPGGGIETTIGGLANLLLALGNQTLLGQTSLLWEAVPKNDKISLYRLGVEFAAANSRVGDRMWHGGAHDNLRTLFHFVPGAKTGVAIFANAEYADHNQIVARIYAALGYSWYTAPAAPDYSCTDVVNSCAGRRFTAVYHKKPGVLFTRHLLNNAAFGKDWSWLANHGYEAVRLMAFNHHGLSEWSALYQRSTKASALWRNFSAADFRAKWDEMRLAGYVLNDIATHQLSTNRYFSGIFSKEGSTAKTAVLVGATLPAFQQADNANKAKGLTLVDLEVFTVNGVTDYSAVWREGSGNSYLLAIADASLPAQIQYEEATGKKIISLNRRNVGTSWVWDLVLTPSTAAQKVVRNLSYCDLMKKTKEYNADGFTLQVFEEY